MQFKILKKSKKSRARLGVIKTKNGVLHTPALFPVATQAAVKTLDAKDIKEIGYEGILCNTYHLMLRPGSSVIKKIGGLHKFMNFQGVITTDSGGFQVFSLGKGLEQGVGKLAKKFFPTKSLITKPVTNLACRPDLLREEKAQTKLQTMVRIREEGVWFRSHIDGKEQFLSPEKSMQIQQDLGSDIAFVFDQPSSPLDSFEETKKTMERTHRWAMRCISANEKLKMKNEKLQSKIEKSEQGLFGIAQGGKYKELRQESAKFIGSLDFDGFGIGGSFGSSYGDSKKNMLQVLDWTVPLLPEEKPRHLLGIGHLEDLEATIKKGIDLFDCCYPTRFARHGVALTLQGETVIAKSKFLLDKTPLDKKCFCPVCQNYSKSYISHLFRAKELTALRLLTLHNLWFFRDFIDNIKEKIEQGKI